MIPQKVIALIRSQLSWKSAKVLKIILTLSHGQASVERGYSISKSLLIEKLTELSHISQRIVLDHLKSKNVSSENFEVCVKLHKSLTSTQGKCQSFSGWSEKGTSEQREGFKTKVNLRGKSYGES